MPFDFTAAVPVVAGLGQKFFGSGIGRILEQIKELERQQAFADAQMESGVVGSNNRLLSDYTGRLNDSLLSMGRTLGDANAAGGVYNSSAVSGALANQGAENAASLSSFASDLADRLAQLRYGNQRARFGRQYDFLQGQLGRAQGQGDSLIPNLASALGSYTQRALGRQMRMPGNGYGVPKNGRLNGALSVPSVLGATGLRAFGR